MATNPILQFAQQSSTTPPPISGGASNNPIRNFAMSTSKTMPPLEYSGEVFPTNKEDVEKMKKDKPSVWRWLGKQLMKPVGLVSTTTEAVGEGLAATMYHNIERGRKPLSFKGIRSGALRDWASEVKTIPKRWGGIITGKSEESFTDLYRENLAKVGFYEMEPLKGLTVVPNDFTGELQPNQIKQSDADELVKKNKTKERTATAIGFIVDIAADPLNALGGGLTRVGSLASKVSKLEKAERVVEEGSRLAKTIKALGLTDDMLTLAPTKAEQAQKGQRAFLTLFSGTQFERVLFKGTSIYEKVGVAKDLIGATKLTQLIKKTFSTKTGNEAFDVVTDHFSNLKDYRDGVAMEKAIELQNKIARLPQGEAAQVIELIETGTKSGVRILDEIAADIKANLSDIKKHEEGLGLLKTEIKDYFPHVRATEKGKVATAVTNLFSKKIFSDALGFAKERKILRFVDEFGNDIGIGTSKRLGLKKVASEKLKAVATKKTNTAIKSMTKRFDKTVKRIEKSTKKMTDGLRKQFLNLETRVEKALDKKVFTSQKRQLQLLKQNLLDENKEVFDTIADLKDNVNSITKAIDNELADISDEATRALIKSSAKLQKEKLLEKIAQLSERVMSSQGIEHMKGAISTNATNAAKAFAEQSNSIKMVNEVAEMLHKKEVISDAKIAALIEELSSKKTAFQKVIDTEVNKVLNELEETIRKFDFFDYIKRDKVDGKIKTALYKAIKQGGEFGGAVKATVSQINEAFGTTFFEDRPAIAFAKRMLASARAVTSREYFNSVKQFALKEGDELFDAGVDVSARELDGFKFEPDIARKIDEYYKAVKPEEMNVFIKMYDTLHNMWKAQALLAPSYHIRNIVGNMWNNFLGGVKNPKDYLDATAVQLGKGIDFVDDAGKRWSTPEIISEAKKTGVLDEGWYAKDIEESVMGKMNGTSFNPLKQNFALFKANRSVGTVFENNARIAHFINKLRQGAPVVDAANSVKKFLFDYGDLTHTEKTFFKRVAPFYTWTRKNIPVQLEALMEQPEKFAGIVKGQEAIESTVEKPNEKYLSEYVKNNVGLRVGNDKDGNTYYFLMGQWLPAAQAVDFISQPGENFIAMISPFFKVPVELWANQSFFFKNSLGEPSAIERYPKENQSWLGVTARKKTVYIMRNIRILNELDKINPGGIFGTSEKEAVTNRLLPDDGFYLPLGMGAITPAKKRTGNYEPEVKSGSTRVLQSLFGKLVPYDVELARKFNTWDVKTKVKELESAIDDARRDGQLEYAKRLSEEVRKIRAEN